MRKLSAPPAKIELSNAQLTLLIHNRKNYPKRYRDQINMLRRGGVTDREIVAALAAGPVIDPSRILK
jgi:hypothetical protein